MSDPSPYIWGYSFTNYQATNPDKPLPGDQLDNELQDIAIATTQLVASIQDVRRSDGALQNGIVTTASLSADVLLGLTPPRPWQSNTVYALNNTVFNASKFYICTTAHTSSVSFDASKWTQLADMTGSGAVDSGLWFTSLEAIKTADYAILAADTGKTIVGNSVSALTFTLGTAASLAGGMYFVKNINSGVTTVRAGTGQSLEGIANPTGIALAQGWAALIWPSGATFRAVIIPDYATRFRGPGSSAAGNLPTFADASGQLLQDSGVALTALGSIRTLPESVQANDYTIATTDAGFVIIANKTTAINFTLPLLANSGTNVHLIRNINTGALALKAGGSDTIEGGSQITIYPGGSAIVWANGTTWKTMNIPKVGDVISSEIQNAGGVSPPGSTAANITSISLPAGVWAVSGNITCVVGIGSTQSSMSGWISVTSATSPANPNKGAMASLSVSTAAGGSHVLGISAIILTLAVTTTVYLSGAYVISSGTNATKLYGSINAVRIA